MKKLLLALLTIVLGASFIYPPAIIRAKDDFLLAVNNSLERSLGLTSSEVSSTNKILSEQDLPGPAGNISGPDSACADGLSEITLSVPEIVNATQYYWSFSSGFNLQPRFGSNTITFKVPENAVNGIGTVQVTGYNDNGYGVSSPLFSIDINPKPSATFAQEVNISLGQTILIGPEVNNSYNYSWTNTSSSTVLS